MQPPDEKPLPLPTVQEAEELRQVALMIYHNQQEHFEQNHYHSPPVPEGQFAGGGDAENPPAMEDSITSL